MTALDRLYDRFDALPADERERRAAEVLDQFDEIERVRAALKVGAEQRLADKGIPIEQLDIVGDFRRRHD